MLLPGKLTIGFLQEDNPQKFYFRVRPLILQEGDTYYAAENVRSEFQDDGYIRIVPDKNELSHFKTRMRALGSYCLLDLRDHPNDNDKIRPNKNHIAENGDRNAFIMYSDVVFSMNALTAAEVVEVNGAPDECLIEKPGTPYVALARDGRLIGLYRWSLRENGARLLPESAIAVEQPLSGLSERLFEVEVEDATPRRLLVDLGHFGATEPVEESPAAPEQPAPAAPEPARVERVERVAERTERIEKNERTRETERPREKKEASESSRPWLQSASAARDSRQRDNDSQSGFNPRRGPCIKEILDDMWRHSRVDQLGHPIPAEAQSVPAANPVEAAMQAVDQAWGLPEARTSLIEGLLKLNDMPDMLGLNGQENAVQARALRVGEEKLAALEADRLQLICEIDELKKKRLDTRMALLQEIEQSHQRELAETAQKLADLNAEREKALEQAQRAKNAASLAGSTLTGLINKQMDHKLASHLLEGHARDLLLSLVYGQESQLPPIKTYTPSVGEIVTDLRVRFAEAGFTLTNDDALNLLICLAQGRLMLISGPTGSGKSLFARTLGAALGLSDNGRFYELTVPNDCGHLGELIESVSPTGVPLVRLNALRELLNISDDATPALLMLDEANRAPIDHYAADLLTLGESGAPQALHTPAETLPLHDALRVVMTLCEGNTGLPLTEKVLDRAWTLRLARPDAAQDWRAPAPKLPRPQAALSLATLQKLFAPAGDVPGVVLERMNLLRKKLADKGVLLSRRALNDTYNYCSAAIALMTEEPLKVLDRALAQRVMPVILAGASLNALHDISALFADMPRCLELLNAPLPLPSF